MRRIVPLLAALAAWAPTGGAFASSAVVSATVAPVVGLEVSGGNSISAGTVPVVVDEQVVAGVRTITVTPLAR